MGSEQKYFSDNHDFSMVMKPDKWVLFFRTCKIWQFIRFIILNVKMLIVVKKSH
jgi:hypothetical protein